jgi:intracellular multiplication protein IcmG
MENNPTSGSESEEEYHFATEPETSGVFAPPSSSSQKGDVMGRIKRKNLLIAAGVIVVVFSIYKILDVIITRHAHEATSPVTQTTEFPTKVTPLPPPPAPMPIEPAAPKPVETASPNTAAVTNRLSALEEQNSNFQSGIEKLNSQVSDLQTAVANINSQISSLSQGIQNIEDKLAEQQSKEAALHAVRIHKHKIRMHVIRIRPIYFVRAIIPGRAWLSTSHGGTVTVRLGDNLPGYGVVQAIDPVQGTITTSVGAIIGYSPGDS